MKTFYFVLFALANSVTNAHANNNQAIVPLTITFENFVAELDQRTVTYAKVNKFPKRQEYYLVKKKISTEKPGLFTTITKQNESRYKLPIESNLVICLNNQDELNFLEKTDWLTFSSQDSYSSPHPVFPTLRNFISETASFLSQQRIDLPDFEEDFATKTESITCTRTVEFMSPQAKNIARAVVTCQRYEMLEPHKKGFNIGVEIQGLSSKNPSWTEPLFKRMLGINASWVQQNKIATALLVVGGFIAASCISALLTAPQEHFDQW